MSVMASILKNVGKDKTTVVMSGPLSELFAKTLNEVYAKDSPITGEPMGDRKDNENNEPMQSNWVGIGRRKFAFESQQLEEEEQLKALAADALASNNDKMYVYAVDGQNTTDDDIRKIATIFSSVKHSSEAALIIQDEKEEVGEEPENAVVAKVFQKDPASDQTVQANKAIAMLAKAFNIRVYKTLDDFKEQVLE